MEVLPGKEAAYEASHNEGFWPEMAECLATHGAHNYSISLNPETRQLFGFVEIESEELWAKIATTETCQKWWKYMTEFIRFGADGRPFSQPLKEVFFFKGN
jgi:L-rhamnose mutarotase